MTNLNVIKSFLAGIPAVTNSKKSMESRCGKLYSFGKLIATRDPELGKIRIISSNETGVTYAHIELLKLCIGEKK